MKTENNTKKEPRISWKRVVFPGFFLALIALGFSMSAVLWFQNKELKAMKSLQPIVYYSISREEPFLNADDVVAADDRETFQAEKKKLIDKKENFIEADLKRMKMSLYENGEIKEEYSILMKGKMGSFWETTTGIYSVGAKSANHFSSIAKVWMPYGVQFYGNFFIHGWPYYSDGTPLQSSYSGGCIRLSTKDAEKVFSFAKYGMPILVFEEKPRATLYEAFTRADEEAEMPLIEAEAAIVADLDTGEVLLDKNSEESFPLGALTKSMTALTVSEVVNLERTITAQSWMLNTPKSDNLLNAGTRYRGFDLLYPLLMQSSNDAATVLGGFLGETGTVFQMNKKAKGLGMSRTTFVDVTGESEKNVSTLTDLSRLAEYILAKRGFVFGVSIGTEYPEQQSITFQNLSNYNPFVGEKNLVGVIGGRTDAVGFTVLTIWQFSKEGKPPRNVLIGVLGSKNANGDIIAIRSWFERNFGVVPR
jgi:D-alanyl-D-alanine carboxypeptidase